MTTGESQNHRSAISHDRFFELTVDPLCVIDRNGRVSRANPALVDLLGYSDDELVSMHVTGVIDPEQETSVREILEAANPTEPITSLELRCRCKDGSHKIIVWNIQPDPADGSLFASGRDITDSRVAERTLRESEERLRLASRAGNLHTWEADVIGDELHWSRNDPQLVDVPLPRTFDEFHAVLHEEDRDGVIDSLKSAIETEGEFQFEYRFANRPLSNQTWLSSTGIAIRDEDAGITRIVGITQDITDRIRRQRRSEFLATIGSDFSRLTSISSILQSVSHRTLQHFAANGLSIVEVDEDSGSFSVLFDSRQSNIDSWDDQRLDLYFSDGMMEAMRHDEVVAITDAGTDPRVREQARMYRDIGIQSMLKAPFTHHDGLRLVVTLLRTGPSEWQDEEIELLREIAYRVGVLVERTRAEDALRESEERYRSLFTSIDEGFCIIERVDRESDDRSDYRYIAANPAFSEQSGVSEVVGKTIRELFPAEAESWFQTYDDVIQTGAPVRFVRHMESVGRTLELYAFPQDASNRRLGVIFQDITARKQTEISLREKRKEAEDAVHARDVFLSIASHELRNPVASIKGAAQLLRRSFVRGRLDEQRTDRLTAALVDSSDRLALLLEDLLDVSRLQSGQMRLVRQPTNLPHLVSALVADEYSRLDEHSIEMELSDGKPVMLDQERIRQILRNVIDNAIKYSPDGGDIPISVKFDDENAYVVIRDSGIGLLPTKVDSIFQPFGRAPNAAESNIPGMGLGLYICRNIALAHGGWLWVESDGENQGLAVHLTLPYIGHAPDA